MSKKKLSEQNDNNDDDLVFEDDIDSPQSFDFASKINSLKKEVETLKKEKNEYLNGWQRSQADYHNLKTKSGLEREQIIKYAKIDLLEELIPLADSFEMAWSNKDAWEQAPQNWRLGIEYIYNQLQTILQNNNVEIINPSVNQHFDPSLHEAIDTLPVETEEEDDKVIMVVKKGYKLYDKIIRPAQVKIGQLDRK